MVPSRGEPAGSTTEQVQRNVLENRQRFAAPAPAPAAPVWFLHLPLPLHCLPDIFFWAAMESSQPDSVRASGLKKLAN